MVDGKESVTVEILRWIRDELFLLRQNTNVRFGEVNSRLDLLTNGQARLATEVAGIRGELHDPRSEVHDPRSVVGRNGERFEHSLATEGDIIRELKSRMARVQHHLGLYE